LDGRGIAKLSDFGVSHMFDEPSQQDSSSNNDSSSNQSLNDASCASLCDTPNATMVNTGNSPMTTPNVRTSPRRSSSSGLTRHDTDMALEMKCMANDGLLTKTEGTWAFWSPEMCDGGKAFSGYAADLWAAGVCLYIFATGKLPFFSNLPLDLLRDIQEANVPYDGLRLSDSLVELLRMTLEKDPAKRAGVGDCLKHPFLLLARAQRIQELSVELAKSKATSTRVSERDIQSAFRIVTSMPVFLLKSATKQIQEGFQAARQRLSMGSAGRSSSFSDRGTGGGSNSSGDKRAHTAHDDSDNDQFVSTPGSTRRARCPSAIQEMSREFEDTSGAFQTPKGSRTVVSHGLNDESETEKRGKVSGSKHDSPKDSGSKHRPHHYKRDRSRDDSPGELTPPPHQTLTNLFRLRSPYSGGGASPTPLPRLQQQHHQHLNPFRLLMPDSDTVQQQHQQNDGTLGGPHPRLSSLFSRKKSDLSAASSSGETSSVMLTEPTSPMPATAVVGHPPSRLTALFLRKRSDISTMSMEDTNTINIACSSDDQSATNAQSSEAPNRLTMSHRASPTDTTLAAAPRSSNQQTSEKSQASPLNTHRTTPKAEDNDTSSL
jgi:Protein kinase domain